MSSSKMSASERGYLESDEASTKLYRRHCRSLHLNSGEKCCHAICWDDAWNGGIDYQREVDAGKCEAKAEMMKQTSHRDGLGMGWQEGEQVCLELARQLREAK